MKKIIACFVLENGTYVEVPVDAVIENGKFKEEYAGRFFYPFNQYLLEMSKEDRRYFYLCREVMKEMVWQPNHGYNKKNRVEVVSLDELVDKFRRGIFFIQWIFHGHYLFLLDLLIFEISLNFRSFAAR